MNKIISPSLLSANFYNLETDLEQLKKEKDLWLHLDIMDGHFVPNLTFGPPVIKKLQQTGLILDAHLMVTNPADYIDQMKNLSLHNFTFHWEAVQHHHRVIQKAKQNFPSVGISFNPSTSVENVPQYLFQDLDLVLIMSVNPGFGGQSFIPGVLDKVKYLKKLRDERNYQFQIQIDGGVSSDNIKMLSQTGVDNFVAGSFVFSNPNLSISNAIQELKSNL